MGGNIREHHVGDGAAQRLPGCRVDGGAEVRNEWKSTTTDVDVIVRIQTPILGNWCHGKPIGRETWILFLHGGLHLQE